MPPSPEQMPVPARSAPRARATLASSESAPKLMSLTNSGISKRNGFAARGPITTSVPTGESSSKGFVASWAVTICKSSHWGSSFSATPMAETGPWCPSFDSPSRASCWISELWRSATVPVGSWYCPRYSSRW
jgi:hypothetical protein